MISAANVAAPAIRMPAITSSGAISRADTDYQQRYGWPLNRPSADQVTLSDLITATLSNSRGVSAVEWELKSVYCDSCHASN